MYASAILSVASALFAGIASAAPTSRDVSSPFNLTLASAGNSGRYNGRRVAACHSGAAVEALCVYDDGNPFTFNSTTPGTKSPGSLVYTLNSVPTPDYQPLQLYYENSGSNIGYGFFGVGTPVELAIASDNQIGVYFNSSNIQYEWHVCNQTFEAYEYETVSFVKDFATPSDPSCVPVSLYQQF